MKIALFDAILQGTMHRLDDRQEILEAYSQAEEEGPQSRSRARSLNLRDQLALSEFFPRWKEEPHKRRLPDLCISCPDRCQASRTSPLGSKLPEFSR